MIQVNGTLVYTLVETIVLNSYYLRLNIFDQFVEETSMSVPVVSNTDFLMESILKTHA